MAANNSKTPPEEKDVWQTPPELFYWLQHRITRPFDFDAACNERNALATPLYSLPGFSPGDSLSHPWPSGYAIFCNPPYSKISPWVDSIIGCGSLVAMVIPSPNGESRYSHLLPAAHEIYIDGRVNFIRPDGTVSTGNPRSTSIFLLGGYTAGTRDVIPRDVVFDVGGQIMDAMNARR